MFWSPGGTRLVMPTFTNAILAFRDTDIVLLDPETWTETNLSDDGFDDCLFGGVPVQWDMVPRWLDDETLMFVRHEVPEDGMGARGTAGAHAGRYRRRRSREVFAPLASGTALVYGLAVSPDGKRVAFVFDFPDGPKENGIHIFEIGSKAPRRLLTVDDVGGIPPFGMSFSADGKYLLTLREHPGTECRHHRDGGQHRNRCRHPHPGARADGLWRGVVADRIGAGLRRRQARRRSGRPRRTVHRRSAGHRGTPRAGGALRAAAVCCGNQPFPWASNDTMVLGNLDEPEKPVLVELAR